MPPIIGVDLGTTNTAVAVLENGRPRVIEDDRGYRVLPSVVSAKGEGRFVVGQAAHNLILTRPDRTAYATKRLIGRRFDSPEVQRVLQRVGYAVQEGPDGGVQIQVGDTWMTPQEVAAVVLQVARGIAEKALGQPVEEAVITVPAHFNHAQRKATLEAAEIAGLRCERLLNEPTAAALAYGHRRNVERTIVIFDLGGGTFDVSVLRLSAGIYEILATNGDTFLGGEDFDYRLVDHLADEFKARTGVDLRKDRAALQRVKDAAERAKCELSFSDRTSVVVAHAAPGQNLESTLTRTQLEQLTGDLVERCVDVARAAVIEAGLTVSEIDEVILVGGQTRMPRIREAVAGVFGREPSRSVHPEEAVAIGAAVHAATLGDVEGTPAVLLDVTPFDLGIDAAGGLFSRIVPRNARIPCSESRTFATVHDEQTSVRITVRQGESRVAEDNEFLGEFLMEGLTPAPRMQTKVAVTFRIDANGILHVSAIEPATGEKRNISIRNYADRNRVVQQPGGRLGDGSPDTFGDRLAGDAPAPVAQKKVAKKKGFFDSLFGSRKPKPKATPTAPPAAEPAPVSSAAAAAAVLEPPPTIAPLPPPAPMGPVDQPVEADADEIFAGEELDEVEADGTPFEMPEEIAEEDLYDPHTAGPASFGLAGAHQVGEAAGGGDPFADLGAPAPRPRAAEPARRDPFAADPLADEPLAGDPFADGPLAGDPFAADGDDPVTVDELFALDADPFQKAAPAARTLTHEELFGVAEGDELAELGGLDAAELFAEVMAGDEADAAQDEEEDPPTDPGLRFPSAARTAAAPTPPSPAPERPPMGGLLFESLIESPQDELGFVLAEPEPGAEPEGGGEDEFDVGFSFDEPSVSAPLPTPAAAPEPAVNPFGFELASPVVPDDPPRPVRAAARADSESTEIFSRRQVGDAESTEVFKRSDMGAADEDFGFVFPMPDEEAAAPKKRKPARVKLSYRERGQLVTEYRDNLLRGGATIRTEKPLATGRECVFEVSGPGLVAPLVIPARVTRAVVDGMEVEYQIDDATRSELLAALGA